MDDSVDNALDIKIGVDSPIWISMDKIKSRLDANAEFPQTVYVVPVGRGKTFSPIFVARIEKLADERYKIHDLDFRLIKDWKTEKVLRETNVFDWFGLKTHLSKMLAQLLYTELVKVDDLKLGDWVERGKDRRRIESKSNTVGGYFVRFDDDTSAQLEHNEELNAIKAS